MLGGPSALGRLLQLLGELPAQAAQIQAFAACFERQQYAGQAVAPAALRQALGELRQALPWRWLN